MKKITLKQNGTFEHQWIAGLHSIPANAIDVTDDVFMQLSQNTQTKKYDTNTNAVIDYMPPFVLADAIQQKYNEIRAAFKMAISLPITDASGVIWDGGYDSALKIDAAKRLAVLAGQTTLDIYDKNNNAHNLSLSDVDNIVLLIGDDYQTKFKKKQAFMNQVDALPGTSTQADIDGIVISF